MAYKPPSQRSREEQAFLEERVGVVPPPFKLDSRWAQKRYAQFMEWECFLSTDECPYGPLDERNWDNCDVDYKLYKQFAFYRNQITPLQLKNPVPRFGSEFQITIFRFNMNEYWQMFSLSELDPSFLTPEDLRYTTAAQRRELRENILQRIAGGSRLSAFSGGVPMLTLDQREGLGLLTLKEFEGLPALSRKHYASTFIRGEHVYQHLQEQRTNNMSYRNKRGE